MAEEYIIGSNAQFNDSVEILKDLTLYGVVENSTDFAVKIQGDEKLRITSDGVLIGDTISHIGDVDTKIRFPENNVISFETAGSERLRIESGGDLKISNNIKSSDSDFYVYSYKGGSDGQVRAGVQYDGTSQRLQFFTATNEKLRITSGGDILTSGNTQLFGSNTNDGSDNKAIMINGGGATSDSRGGYLIVHGNEHSSNPGLTRLHAGNVGTAGIEMFTAGSKRLGITSDGNLQFNSGFGSVQTAYGVRAWALWNGETNTLLDDGNIAGFTDGGVGTYTFTFDNNMPDGNYVVTGSTGRNAKPHFSLGSNIRTASEFRVSTGTWGSVYEAIDVDSAMFCVIC